MKERQERQERQGGLTSKKQALLEERLRQRGLGRREGGERLGRREGGGPAPLSFAQQRLWFLQQLDPEMSVYNIPRNVRLLGSLSFCVLEKSLSEVIQRHESLRTTFQVYDERPLQVIHPVSLTEFTLTDLGGIGAEEREQEVQRLAQQEAQRSFDLARGPLLRTVLLHVSEEEHVLLTTMHHIISDAWSSDIFVRELSTCYNALQAGNALPLSPLPLQYVDYALWQRNWLQGEVLEQQLAYWRAKLADLAPLELPTDRPRPAVQRPVGAQQTLLLPPELLSGLQALSQREGVTLFMTLLAAFQVLLARYSGQDDIAVGTPIANRAHIETEQLIGFFINTLVMRCDLSTVSNFRQLLGQVREVALGAYAHQDVPFEKLVEVLQPERNLSVSPLFQVMFVLQHTSGMLDAMSELQVRPLSDSQTTAKFDLTLAVRETVEGLSCRIEYNTDLFESATIERMLAHWQTLLTGILADQDQPLSSLPLLTTKEQHWLARLNETSRPYRTDACIHTLFAEQVARTPDQLALVYEDVQLTYVELDRCSTSLAYELQRRGVGPEVLVGICLERSLEMVITILAIFKAGGGYVPLDPAYPEERLAFILKDAGASLFVSQPSVYERLPLLQKQATEVLILTQDLLASLSIPDPVVSSSQVDGTQRFR